MCLPLSWFLHIGKQISEGLFPVLERRNELGKVIIDDAAELKLHEGILAVVGEVVFFDFREESLAASFRN